MNSGSKLKYRFAQPSGKKAKVQAPKRAESLGEVSPVDFRLKKKIVRSSLNNSDVSSVSIAVRQKFLAGLVAAANHDYHKESSAHVFYCFYADSLALHAMDMHVAKAFDNYVVQAKHLAASAADAEISQWISFLTKKTEALAIKDQGLIPCSGVVNFMLVTDEDLLRREADTAATSINKVSEVIFLEQLTLLEERLLDTGPSRMTAAVKETCNQMSLAHAKKYTVRIDKLIHAQLLSRARELSVPLANLATYLAWNHCVGELARE